MITAEHIAVIGVGMGTDPGMKTSPDVAKLQAIVNLTEVMKSIALILIDIRDGKKAA